jgi:hypothetical protein
MNMDVITVAVQLFGATFITVFALGVQSLNVNGGHKAMAAITSLAIGASNLVLLKILPGPTGWAHHLGYFAGGVAGILAAMHYQPKLAAFFRRRKARAPAEAGAHLQEALHRFASELPAFEPTAPPSMPVEPTSPHGRPNFPLLVALAQSLIDGEQLGHAATPEMRRRACVALGRLQSVPTHKHN